VSLKDNIPGHSSVPRFVISLVLPLLRNQKAVFVKFCSSDYDSDSIASESQPVVETVRKVSKSTFNLKSVTKTLSLVSLIGQVDNDLFYLHFFKKIASIINKGVILGLVICQQKHLNF